MTKRMTLGELRQTIREEYLRGVPEFMLRDVTRRYVESIRAMIERHIEMTKRSSVESQEAREASNDAMKSLEDDVYQVLEDKLWRFMQRT